jgi:hypothetical protein
MDREALIRIAAARMPDDIGVVRSLFTEYITGLGVDLSFQDVDAEAADLPGRYAAPALRACCSTRWRRCRPPRRCMHRWVFVASRRTTTTRCRVRYTSGSSYQRAALGVDQKAIDHP